MGMRILSSGCLLLLAVVQLSQANDATDSELDEKEVNEFLTLMNKLQSGDEDDVVDESMPQEKRAHIAPLRFGKRDAFADDDDDWSPLKRASIRPLRFGKRASIRPLRFGKRLIKPLRFGKRFAADTDFADFSDKRAGWWAGAIKPLRFG